MRLAGILAAYAIGVASPLAADENAIPEPSIRLVGYHAQALADMIRAHAMAPEGITVLGPDEPGEVTTQFVTLLGWDSVAKVPGAEEVCGELCAPADGKVLHLVSSTIVEGENVRKSVFIDLSVLAPKGDITGSFGLSGCVIDQVLREAVEIKPKTHVCLPRLVGGSYTNRRNVTRRN